MLVGGGREWEGGGRGKFRGLALDSEVWACGESIRGGSCFRDSEIRYLRICGIRPFFLWRLKLVRNSFPLFSLNRKALLLVELDWVYETGGALPPSLSNAFMDFQATVPLCIRPRFNTF